MSAYDDVHREAMHDRYDDPPEDDRPSASELLVEPGPDKRRSRAVYVTDSEIADCRDARMAGLVGRWDAADPDGVIVPLADIEYLLRVFAYGEPRSVGQDQALDRFRARLT